MAVGEFYTYSIWELRPGHQGRELEELTRLGIVPQYGRVEGVKSVKLFRIDEGEDAGKYISVTVYESREAFNKWFTSTGREIQAWEAAIRPTTERWIDVAGQTRVHRASLLLDHEYEQPDAPQPPPSSSGPRIVF
ncbi:MAG TPA: antibiotic biosynthesis monooxygenase [Chloroflexia bacterium]|nr:antibiotic biosynthesis monooxygenase [Chloroflexia bacterium]